MGVIVQNYWISAVLIEVEGRYRRKCLNTPYIGTFIANVGILGIGY